MSEEDIFNELVLQGGLKFSGVDPVTGQNLYIKTDKLKALNPELDKEISNFFSETMMSLWQKGFIDMDVTEEQPMVNIAQKSFDTEQFESLDQHERLALLSAIKIISDKK